MSKEVEAPAVNVPAPEPQIESSISAHETDNENNEKKDLVTLPKAAEDAVSCLICFEETKPNEIVQLPCDCIQTFCMRCFDRSLACSLINSGTASCPTCRMPIEVDFDPDTGVTSFRRGVQPATNPEDIPPGARLRDANRRVEETRIRIFNQVRPLLLNRLSDFGARRRKYFKEAADKKDPNENDQSDLNSSGDEENQNNDNINSEFLQQSPSAASNKPTVTLNPQSVSTEPILDHPQLEVEPKSLAIPPKFFKSNVTFDAVEKQDLTLFQKDENEDRHDHDVCVPCPTSPSESDPNCCASSSNSPTNKSAGISKKKSIDDDDPAAEKKMNEGGENILNSLNSPGAPQVAPILMVNTELNAVPLPMCACGGLLSPQSLTARCQAICNSLGTISRDFWRVICPTVRCDICNQPVLAERDAYVWNCSNGDNTILHATSFDICAACFMLHAGVSEAQHTSMMPPLPPEDEFDRYLDGLDFDDDDEEDEENVERFWRDVDVEFVNYDPGDDPARDEDPEEWMELQLQAQLERMDRERARRASGDAGGPVPEFFEDPSFDNDDFGGHRVPIPPWLGLPNMDFARVREESSGRGTFFLTQGPDQDDFQQSSSLFTSGEENIDDLDSCTSVTFSQRDTGDSPPEASPRDTVSEPASPAHAALARTVAFFRDASQ